MRHANKDLSQKVKDNAYDLYLKYTLGPKVSKLVFEANWELFESHPLYQAYLMMIKRKETL
jgi:hypothetical protein